MKTRNHFCTKLVLGAFLIAFSQLTWAIGLGEAQLESFLGQPLEVKIELITHPTDDLAAVSAGLASVADYELIGASRNDISVPLLFSVKQRDGSAYIAVTSESDIKNPVLRLILEVKWSNGRMLREYTLFLDPPTFSQPAPAPHTETARATVAQPTTVPQPAVATTTAPVSTSVAMDDAVISEADEYGPVQSGDTLWRIAKDWSVGRDLNINKVMLAIQRENPRAFVKNNINLLQRGAILRMPHRDDVNSVSSASAFSEVRKQSVAFQEQSVARMARSTVPLLARDSAAVAPALDLQNGEESLAESTTEGDVPGAELPGDMTPSQLELLPPSEDVSLVNTYGFEDSQTEADDPLSAQVLREELSRKEEELINQQKQNTYLEQRLEELERQLAESREGTVEDENLAGMEERLRQERLAESQTVVPKVVTAPTPEKPWYSRYSLWLLVLLVLVVIAAGWLVSRFSGSDTVVSDLSDATDPLREIKDEAEEVLRVLDSSSADKVVSPEPQTTESDEFEGTQTMPASDDVSRQDEDTHVLDEESVDPEIQLDLARAYISMGDKESARVILEEVIANGSAQQQAEAKKMQDEF